MTSLQDLKQIEQNSLATLEASYQQLTTNNDNFARESTSHQQSITALYQQMAMVGSNNMAAITAAEESCLGRMRQYCEYLGQWQSYFMSFESTARTLGTGGLPRLSIRLHEIGADLSVALDTYRNMCASMVKNRQARFGIYSDTIDQINRTISQVLDTQKHVFETFHTRWSNEAFNKCPICGSLLQSRSLPICWRCGKKVIRF